MDMQKKEILTGRYQGSGRGYGFFIPEGATDRGGDCFVPPDHSLGAWDGDTVEAAPAPEDPTQPGRREARIVRILERGNKTVTGTIRRIDRQLWLKPDNERLRELIRVTGRTKARDGEKAAVAVTSYGTPNTPPMGTLKASFGPADTRAAAVEAILYRQDIHRDFSPQALAEAEKTPQAVPEAAMRGRHDLRSRQIITIDGVASKDLDDAISLEREGDKWLLGVHIADVSAYVRPGSALDADAFERGTSVYFADQVVPMLPVALSNGICSLNEGEDRLTLSCFMTMTDAGEVTGHSIEKTVIRSAHRMSYEDCNRMLAGQAPALAERYADILPMLRDMAALAKRLERRRKNRGSLDLDTAESAVVCDSEGRAVDVVSRRQGESEKLIESFMLAANETVAEHLVRLGFPGVFRIHEKPTQDKTDTLRAMLSPLGYVLRQADHGSLQKVLDDARGKSEAPAVSMMVLRSMMKARYSAENQGHFGIAAEYYCHFTSPIRRYPDLMVHRCLHALLDGARVKGLKGACQSAAEQSSRRELAAQSAERDIDKLYFAEYMRAHLGEEFPAAVTGVTRLGLFAALPNGVEGFVPAETLGGDRYEYDEQHMTLIGTRGGQSFTLGTPLRVVCVAADASTGRIDFRPPDWQGAPLRSTEKQRSEAPKQKRKPPFPGKRRGGRPAMHVPKRGHRGKRK